MQCDEFIISGDLKCTDRNPIDRMVSLVKLLTELRRQRPELWEQIRAFARDTSNQG